MFNPHNLSVLSYANGFTLWHYRTNDTLNDLLPSTEYFKAAVDMFSLGDMVLVNAHRNQSSIMTVAAKGADYVDVVKLV